jgi:hypothetical protein
VSGAFAALALALAAAVWQGGPAREARPGEVVALDCAVGQLQAIAVRGARKQVEIDFGGDGGWIRVTSPRPAPLSFGVTPTAAPAPDAATPTETRELAASERLERLAEAWAPLRAQRGLGVLPAERLGPLGLGADAKEPERVEVRCAGQAARAFVVGGLAYGGAGRYVRDEASGEVYLLGDAALADARLADLRFAQRDLHAFALRDVAQVEVSAGAARATLLHLRREQTAGDAWARAAAPERSDEMIGNWLASLLRLRVVEQLGRGVEPGQERTPPQPSEVVARLRWELPDRKEREASLELRRVGQGKDAAFYARSEATRGWVTLPQAGAQRVVDDLPTLLGAAAP